MKHRIKRVRNSYYKKLTHYLWDDDFKGKRKKKFITRIVKAKQREIDNKEIRDELNGRTI